jgi:hypothetical protein
MALASTAQVRAAYNNIVARGEVATPATVAKELGSGYSLASISNKLGTIKREKARQAQMLSRPATTARPLISADDHDLTLYRVRLRSSEAAVRMVKAELDTLKLETLPSLQSELEQTRTESKTIIETQQRAILELQTKLDLQQVKLRRALAECGDQRRQYATLHKTCVRYKTESAILKQHTSMPEHSFRELCLLRQILHTLYGHRITNTEHRIQPNVLFWPEIVASWGLDAIPPQTRHTTFIAPSFQPDDARDSAWLDELSAQANRIAFENVLLKEKLKSATFRAEMLEFVLKAIRE